MTKAEILSQIKKAEQDASAMIAQANDAKSHKVAEAKNRAKELLKTAEEEARRLYEKMLEDAKKEIAHERELIIAKGMGEVESINNIANKRLKNASNFLMTEFERALHV